MKLCEMLDGDGKSIQDYADALAEKARDRGMRYVLILVGDSETPFHVVTNVAGAALPRALRGLAREMSRPPVSETSKKLEVPS